MKNSASLITLGSYPTSLDPAGPARVAQLMFLSEVLDSELNVQAMIFH
jgi:hypothetical protein